MFRLPTSSFPNWSQHFSTDSIPAVWHNKYHHLIWFTVSLIYTCFFPAKVFSLTVCGDSWLLCFSFIPQVWAYRCNKVGEVKVSQDLLVNRAVPTAGRCSLQRKSLYPATGKVILSSQSLCWKPKSSQVAMMSCVCVKEEAALCYRSS